MKRPIGFTILSILTTMLAIAGFLLFYWYLLDNTMQLSAIKGWGALVSGLSAGAFAVGLFLYKRWVFQTSIAWAFVMLVRDVLEAIELGSPRISGPAIIHQLVTYSMVTAVIVFVFMKRPKQKIP